MMPLRSLLSVLLLLCTGGTVTARTTDDVFLRLSVTDGSGRALPGAEAIVTSETRDPLVGRWQVAGDDGVIEVRAASLRRGREIPTGTVPVLVRAPAHGWVVREIHLDESCDVSVALPPGRRIALTLSREDGQPIPDTLRPIIFARGWSVAAWVSVQHHGSFDRFSASHVQRDRERFLLDLPSEPEQIWLLIDHPGYLRACQIGPIEPAAFADGALEIVLPAPGGIDVTLRPHESRTHAYSGCGARLTFHPVIPDGSWIFPLKGRFGDGQRFRTSFDDLAPGRYLIDAYTGDADTFHDETRRDFYQESQEVAVSAGRRSHAEILMQTFDEAAMRADLGGDHRVRVTIARADGATPAGLPYRVVWSSYNFRRKIAMLEGMVPESGVIDVLGLGDRTFTFELQDRPIGTLEPGRAAESSFTLAPRAGDVAPDITLTRLDGAAFTLRSLRGHVVFLEFWASWCGPCQRPMAEYDKIMRTNAARWRGRAVIIGASIDEQSETIRRHVTDRGWNNVLQAHCGAGAWESAPARSFAVRSVPTGYLIDPEGRIAWTGHPASIDVERRITELLRR